MKTKKAPEAAPCPEHGMRYKTHGPLCLHHKCLQNCIMAVIEKNKKLGRMYNVLIKKGGYTLEDIIGGVCINIARSVNPDKHGPGKAAFIGYSSVKSTLIDMLLSMNSKRSTLDDAPDENGFSPKPVFEEMESILELMNDEWGFNAYNPEVAYRMKELMNIISEEYDANHVMLLTGEINEEQFLAVYNSTAKTRLSRKELDGYLEGIYKHLRDIVINK